MSRWILTSLCLCLALSCQLAAETRYIYLVRHAEKQAGKDPELTQAGHQRAAFYADYFKHLAIEHIFASHFKRNQQTAKPIAQQLGLKLQAFDPYQQQAFAEQLQQLQGNSIVVAHNHLTEIIRGLGGNIEGVIDHSDYRRIYQLVLVDNQLVDVLRYEGPQ